MGEKSVDEFINRLAQVLPRTRPAEPSVRRKRWVVTPENVVSLERELRFQAMVVGKALDSFPQKFDTAAAAKIEWRRLAKRAAEQKDNRRRARAAERAERHWKLYRARDSVRAGLSLLLAGRFGDAIERLIEAWYWGPKTITAAIVHLQGQKGARAGANARQEHLAVQQEIFRKYESELPNVRAQIAASRPSLHPATLERLAGKRARRRVADGLGSGKDTGRKRVIRALSKAGKTKTED